MLDVDNRIVRAECQYNTGYMVDLKDKIKSLYLKTETHSNRCVFTDPLML